MRRTWLRIGILSLGLFAVNVAGRLWVRLGSIEDIDAQNRITLLTYGVIGLVMAVLAILWARARPMGEVGAELAAAAAGALALILIAGPFISGTTPKQVGAGDSFDVAWQYAGIAGGGAIVGLLLVIAVGQDYKSRRLKRFAEQKLTRPKRPVRR